MLVFGFRNTIAEDIARQLSAEVEVILVDSSVAAIQALLERMQSSDHSHIIGIGQYTGRDQNAIRIETHCTSQFRNSKAVLRTVAIPYEFTAEPPFKNARGIGNSWCNLVSYEILKTNPNARYTFLHVPKRYDVDAAVLAIKKQLAILDS